MVDRDLFNAAFLSCWSELSEDQQDELIRSIELALTSQDIAEVTQTLLNLAEFMEHSDKVSVELQQLCRIIESLRHILGLILRFCTFLYFLTVAGLYIKCFFHFQTALNFRFC